VIFGPLIRANSSAVLFVHSSRSPAAKYVALVTLNGNGPEGREVGAAAGAAAACTVGAGDGEVAAGFVGATVEAGVVGAASPHASSTTAPTAARPVCKSRIRVMSAMSEVSPSPATGLRVPGSTTNTQLHPHTLFGFNLSATKTAVNRCDGGRKGNHPV